MKKLIKVLVAVILFIVFFYNFSFGQSNNCEDLSLYDSSYIIKVQVLHPDSTLEKVMDAVLEYKFKDTCLLENTYYDIDIIEDSLKQRIAISVGLGIRCFTNLDNIAGIIEKDRRIFVLYKKTASIVSTPTCQIYDLMTVKYKHDFIFDGPRWIYIYYRESDKLELWRADFIFPEDLEND